MAISINKPFVVDTTLPSNRHQHGDCLTKKVEHIVLYLPCSGMGPGVYIVELQEED